MDQVPRNEIGYMGIATDSYEAVLKYGSYSRGLAENPNYFHAITGYEYITISQRSIKLKNEK